MKEVLNINTSGQYLISVIIPVYNAGKFLKKSVESVINQSYKNFEIIFVNDGSTDNSGEICNQYAFADKRIKVISQKNRGPASARNAGVRNAAGDFVFFLDADDFIDKKTFEILVEKFEEYKPDMVMANFRKFENTGEIINQKATFSPDGQPFTGEEKILSKDEILEYVRHFLRHPSNHLISYCWARLYKLSVIRDNNILAKEDMRLFEDFVFNLEYLKHTDKIAFVNKPLYTYVMPNNYSTASMAIINGEGLLHDMNVFKIKVIEFFSMAVKSAEVLKIKKEIGHALTHYSIIFMIRSCRNVNNENKEKISAEINKIINAPIFIESLKDYSPVKGNSRTLPLLAKLKLTGLIILYCEYKALKRYGKFGKN